MTEAETRIVVDLHSQGLSVREITQERPTFSYDDVYSCLEENGLAPLENLKYSRYEDNNIKKYRKKSDTMETNKKSTKPLSDDIKAKVLELHEAGMTDAAIAVELCIGTSSVYRILKKAKQPTPEDLQDLPTAEEKEPAPVAAKTSSEPDWETLTVETAETPLTPITNYTADKEFCQALLADIDTAIKMLMECALGDDVYSSTKTAYDIGGAVIKLQDAYNMLEEKVYET